MAVTSGYALSLPATWIPIPTGFPWQSFDDPTAWATEVADSLLEGLDAPQEVRSGVREAAEALQTMPSPLPGALERFWRVEGIGGPTVVAHLYVTESDVDSAEGLMDMVRAGIGGRVQTWRVWTDTAFEHAIEAVIVAEIDGATVASVRQIGVRAGLVYLLDFLTEDPLLLEAVQSELQDIFRSIHFAIGV